MGFPGGAVVKNTPASARDKRGASSITGWGRPPGIGNSRGVGIPLQYSCLARTEEPGVTKS